MQAASDHEHVLFQPFKLGRMQLAHRIVMAPLSRYRANKNHVHGDLAVEYYSQRASVPGTFLITETTFISPQAGGFDYAPGIYNSDQIAAWKRVTDAVHAKGSFIYLQLWALGRVAKPEVLAREGGFPLISASSRPISGGETPRPLSISEIQQYILDFAQAARNAIEAGFDGVEIQGSNGYLVDQFLQDVSNERTDEYGGSFEGRSRFGLEVVKAVADAIGQDRTAIRLSPWAIYQEMRMSDPIPQFLHFITSLRNNCPNLAYIHLIEPPVVDGVQLPGSNDIFRDVWAPKPLLSASGYTLESAIRRSSEQRSELIVFGRHFLANPDLPYRLKHGIPLNHYDRKTFYTPQIALGYTDYPFAKVKSCALPKTPHFS